MGYKNMSMGKRIIEQRERKGITQAKLAQMTGVTKATMCKYENDRTIPRSDIMGKIADVLNTTSDFLIGRTNDYSPLQRDKEWIQLTETENELLQQFGKLNSENQVRILERTAVYLED